MSGRGDWASTIVTDGGPVLVVDSTDFAQWTGDEPFTSLRARRPGRPGTEDRRRVLHFWGNLGGAGEQFVECESEAEAADELAKLCAKVKMHVPDAIVREEDDVTVIVDPKSGGELRAELEPRSEYDASWQSNPDVDGWEHPFGEGARGFFWDPRGKGGVDIGVFERGETIALVRFLPSGSLSREDEAKERDAARDAVLDGIGSPPVAVGTVTIASGRIVIVWSPVAPAGLDDTWSAGAEALATDGVQTTLTTDVYGPKYGVDAVATRVGTIVRVEPGRYAATIGSVTAPDGAGWAARYCRLVRA